MSTKAIRKALERLAELENGSGPETLRALVEVQKIERAAKSQQGRYPEDINSDFWELMESVARDAPQD